MRGLLHLLKARDWSSFRAALADVGDPSLNIVYADVDGNIGYQYVARVPKRRHGHGLVPSPGWDDSHAWDGWVPFDELPSALNPPQGYALSANNKPAPDSYPHFLGADWYPGYRAARIDRMLQAKPRFTINDFQNMQMDVFSVQAEALVPLLTLAEGSNQLEKRIVRELETWNLRIEVDSFPAAAYEVMRLHLLDLVFGDKLGSLAGAYKGKSLNAIFSASTFAGKASLCLVNLLEQDESWWFRDAATGASRTRDELLRVALKRTADTLYELIGKDPRKWAWGKVHQIEFPHLFGRNRFMRTMFNRGQYPISGDEQTVWMTAQNLELPFGLVTTTATYRQVLDVGDWDRSTAILSTGQSGQPTSQHYADHFELWREGEQHAMLWSRQAVDAEAEATLWLRRAEGESEGEGWSVKCRVSVQVQHSVTSSLSTLHSPAPPGDAMTLQIDMRAAWNRTSAGYQRLHQIPTDAAHYGPWAPDESELRLLGDVRGKRILEIGCGGGQCSIAFARQGAIAVGIDLSDEQLAFASQLAQSALAPSVANDAMPLSCRPFCRAMPAISAALPMGASIWCSPPTPCIMCRPSKPAWPR